MNGIPATLSPIVQLVEQRLLMPYVPGSSPGRAFSLLVSRKARRVMQDNQTLVREFHETFGHPTDPREVLFLRRRLIDEEFKEVMHELRSPVHKAELAKELADLLYVVYGTAEAYDIPLDAVFTEVHASNMSKVGDDGQPVRRDDGKVLKGPNYRKADVAKVLEVVG